MKTWKPTADWGSSTTRRYSVGVDRGMIYVGGIGFAWAGLTSVDRKGTGGSPEKVYLDGQLNRVRVPKPDYEASVESFTYPDAFEQCLGVVSLGGGLKTPGGRLNSFDFSYRNLEGDGLGYDEHYTIHFAWNCVAVPSNRKSQTISASPTLETFSWEIHGIPSPTNLHGPSPYVSVSTRDADPVKLDALEQIIYGADGSTPTLPSIGEVYAILNG